MAAMTDKTDAAIARAWPKKWAKANDASLPYRSRARHRLRRQWRDKCKIDALVRADSKCGNCSQFRPIGHPKNVSFNGKMSYCDLHSDFHGWQQVSADNLCTDWIPEGATHD